MPLLVRFPSGGLGVLGEQRSKNVHSFCGLIDSVRLFDVVHVTGFEPAQANLLELESSLLDHSSTHARRLARFRDDFVASFSRR